MKAEDLVTEAIEEYLGVVPRYDRQTDWHDLGADSLDLVELLLVVEDKIGVEINEKQLSQVHTVGEFMDLVDRYLERSAANDGLRTGNDNRGGI